MLKNKILVHALVFLPLREIEPSIDEKRIIRGGTVYRDSNRTTLGRYPVMTLTQKDLDKKVISEGKRSSSANLKPKLTESFSTYVFSVPFRCGNILLS
jgi:hypothetical protein